MNYYLFGLVVFSEIALIILFIYLIKFFKRSINRQPEIPKRVIKNLKF